MSFNTLKIGWKVKLIITQFIKNNVDCLSKVKRGERWKVSFYHYNKIKAFTIERVIV